MTPVNESKASLHFTTVENKMPKWMQTATAQTFQAIRDALANTPHTLEQACRDYPAVANALAQEHQHYRDNKQAVHQLFRHLPSLVTFATQLLTDAIKHNFQLDVDVERTYLFDAVGYAHQRQQGAAEPGQFVKSLKHHALQNFEASAIQPGGLDVPTPQMRSVILDHRGYQKGPPFDNVVNIDPAAFAALCRELDIGGKYFAMLDKIYYPEPAAGETPQEAQMPVADTLSALELSAFRQSLHLAFLRGAISRASYDAVLSTPLEVKEDPAQPQATFSFLTLWGVELTGMLLITFARSLPASGEALLYTPQDNETPLREYSSFETLRNDLRDRVQQNLAVIAGHIPDASKTNLLGKLQDHLLPLTFTLKNIYERVADPHAVLPITPRNLSYPLGAELIYQAFIRHRDDALFHAVPTKAMDAKTFKERLAYFESLAFDALNLVGFVLPEVGAFMLAVSTLQLGYEVYEGIESWSNDDRHQAFQYMVDVLENVAMMVIAAAGSKALMAELREAALKRLPVEAPSFIEELEDVELPNGDQRLWRPDLAPYVQEQSLPADASPDAMGFYHHGGKKWLVLEGKTYAVRTSSASGTYHLEHPRRANAYAPPLRHNDEGAWLHGLDRPREWQTVQLFGRLGPMGATFDEATALRILAVSGIDEGMLRRVLSESEQLPALLKDTMQRFRLDQEVMQTFAEASPATRYAEFEARYRQLPASEGSGAAVIQRIYPKLPAVVIDELLGNASQAEQQMLVGGKIPKRIGDEVRHFQQQLRLSRAYEGLFLKCVDNPDTERLMLHALQQVPGWSESTAIELRKGTLAAERVDGIGPEDSTPHVIKRTSSGYEVVPGQLTHATLFDAVLAALPDEQRQHLATAGISDGPTLSDQATQLPLLPRWALRKALNMQRPGPRSPMRLADGRIGYRLSGGKGFGSGVSRTNLLHQLNDLTLAPEFTVTSEAILTALEAAGRSPEQIQDRIRQLFAERRELQASLDAPGPGLVTGFGARAANRAEIEAALWDHWIHNAVPELGESLGTLRLQNMFIAEFPEQLPEFISSRMRRLQLQNISLDHAGDGSLSWEHFEAQLNNVFRHFPNLDSLEVDRGYGPNLQASEFANSIPLIIRSFPHLSELRFVNQNAALYPLDIDRLASRSYLTRLDLSGNRFDSQARFTFPDWQLEYLGLDRMAIERWPLWLNEQSLQRVQELSLRENLLTVIPHYLEENTIGNGPHTLISLEENPILPNQLRNLHLIQDGQRRRFSFNLDLPPSLEARLTGLQDERRQLHDAVDHWANASSSSAPLTEQTRRDRTLIGQSILDFWLQRVRGLNFATLHVEGVALSDFPPRLPPFFYNYLEHLRLRRVAATPEALNALIVSAPMLRSLTLEGHVQPMRTLPSALVNSRINELYLREQGLMVDQQTLDSLAGMRELIALDLSGNHFAPALHSPADIHRPLQRLSLRNAGLQRWPEWLDDWMPLHVLDLDDNQLTELPEHILQNPESHDGFTSISLADNPLNDETLRRAHLSHGRHRRYTFDLDLTPELLTLMPPDYLISSDTGSSTDSSPGSTGSTASLHRHSPVPWAPGDIPDVSRWLTADMGETVVASRRSAWETLQQGAEASDLLALAGRLTQSAPYRNATGRSSFIERLWEVLQYAAEHREQRLLFNGMAQDAAANRTCHDGALLVFKQIEEQLLVSRMAAISPQDGEGDTLYRLTRRLFRQNRIDEIARLKAEADTEIDEAEVRLAYQRRLATALDLQAPADHMLYESAARLQRGELENVERQVREAEAGEAFLAFAEDLELWVNHLRATHAERFQQLKANYLDREAALFEQHPDESIDALAPQMQALQEQWKQEERALIRELTNHAGKDLP
ncbi:NEL-type E3 ubiquitin ligase domain-containing protein [Pseudomonas sp. PSKL.D1]|uniref:NEL-type E3 ubiquitin ligase domain-containing protein n=1 Tax=Pseudomonas sp. PSKL.D1 TaxID=3029060 RepID=UPI0023813185|nr:NEL-type E3 ubiquitin ligase domain-containing protein [Pseudomonas sp. PSKL.D1]WDY58431.1 NEL-type E3 ubiquitin ligase domain-containing protein [Pseudomonas sp. PSKL.D1]